jgi:hypothetical protein
MGRIVGNCNLFIHLNAGNSKKGETVSSYTYMYTYTHTKEINTTNSVNES